MATLRQIQSPGVQINEIDLSTRAQSPNGTSILVVGFAPQGPTAEIVNLTTVADLQNIYGTPTNAAERYFYYSVQQLFSGGTNATVNVARLPYGGGLGNGFQSNTTIYTALAYPVVPVQSTGTLYTSTVSAASGIAYNDPAVTSYYITTPTLVELSQADYNTLKQGGLNWSTTGGGSNGLGASNTVASLSSAGIIVLNEAQVTVNEKFEGYYLNFSDSTRFGPTVNYDSAAQFYSLTTDSTPTYSFTSVPSTTLAFAVSSLSSYANIDSVSHTIENIPTFNIGLNSGYEDNVVMSLFKLSVTPYGNNTAQLTYTLQEGYVGSLYANAKIQNPAGGAPVTNFLQTVVNNASPNVSVLINPNLAISTNWYNTTYAPGTSSYNTKVVRVYRPDTVTGGTLPASYLPASNLYTVGTWAPTLDSTNVKIIGDVPSKLEYVLGVAENADVYNVDIVAEAGLATIYAGASAYSTGVFDDTLFTGALATEMNGAVVTSTNGNYSPGTVVTNWQTVQNKLQNFAQFRRKDCVFISDPLRYTLVQGATFKILDDKTKNFSQNIYWPLRNTYSPYNSNYMVAYGNWAKITDSFSGRPAWLPFSGFAAAIYTNNDAVAYPWGAPAGLNRGIVTGISDLAINPQQKQRDLLYKISINPVVNYPNEGFVVMGQKTMQKAPSAFDRVNVRRLFLYLEKSVLNTTKYFVFEPNTSFTRNRLVNTITPVFELAKNTQGIYDYLIVCNDTNNPPSVIDDNSLVVDIYIKPVRTAEFILVNFYATRTDQNFQELLQ